MLTSSLNVAIALVDGRPQDAREILRASIDSRTSGPAVARLQQAIGVRIHREINLRLHQLLGKSLAVDVDGSRWDADSFLAGVKALEDLIEREITDAGNPANPADGEADRYPARS